jgi:hypothetical protein
MPTIPKNPQPSNRHQRRAGASRRRLNQLRQAEERRLTRLRRADDRLRVERARWAAAGFKGPAPEMRGSFDGTITLDTDGATVIFPRITPATTDDVGQATGESAVEIDERRQIRRTKSFESQAGPPKNAKARRCLPPAAGPSVTSAFSAITALPLPSPPPQSEFLRAVAHAPSPKSVQPKSAQPRQWFGLRHRAANGNPPPSFDAREAARARPLSIFSGRKS